MKQGCNRDSGGNQRQGAGIRNYTSRIVCPLSDQAKKLNLTWDQYRDQILWTNDSQVFQANLLPLGRHDVNCWPASYKKRFGYDRQNQQAYYHCVKNTRFPAIRTLRKKHKPQAIVGFGVGVWDLHQCLWQLTSVPSTLANGAIQVYDKERIILAPFFDNRHMGGKRPKHVSDKLSDWDVKIL